VGEIETDTVAGVIDTAALPDAVVCAALWAVTVTEVEGTVAGAVYMPVEVIVPTVELPPTVPFTIQPTAVLLVPETEALNCFDCPTCTLALVGEIDTDTLSGGSTETTALADADVCTTLCAVMVMVPDGAVIGAVYEPDEEIIPVAEFPPTVPLTSQFTLVLVAPDTEALNCCDCPT